MQQILREMVDKWESYVSIIDKIIGYTQFSAEKKIVSYTRNDDRVQVFKSLKRNYDRSLNKCSIIFMPIIIL